MVWKIPATVSYTHLLIQKIILMILMGAKNAKTYFVLVKQKIQKKWYMIMTIKQSKIKPSDLRKHPMIMKRY